jgi:putative NADH-flavin reductase
MAKRIAVVGATGGLGQEIVLQSVAAGYEVIAVVRDVVKAKSMFESIASVVHIATADLSSGEGLTEAFTGVQVVVEVVSNTERPHNIQNIVSKCEITGVSVFVACGGAGQLFIDPERSKRLVTVLETMPNMEWVRPVTDLHMAVQDMAFKSDIPTVFQITPPGMSSGSLTGEFKASKDMAAGVNSLSYQDVASVLLDSLNNALFFDRAMMGLAAKS